MTSVDVFCSDTFNAVEWVNNLCAQKKQLGDNGAEGLDKFLSEMEMRLQLSAEEIEAGLQDSSNQALRRIPYAVQEIYRLQGDIQGMQDRVKATSQQVAVDACESASSVASIAQLDMVKRNVESASATLSEATELSSLFIKVEEVFAAGDLAVVASMLSSMRRSLSLVGDVPEFRAGRETLHALEDRLQGMVEGQLAEALTQSGNMRSAGAAEDAAAAGQEEPAALDDRIRTLCGLLMAVGRYGVIEQQFVATRTAMATRLWQALLQQHASTAPPQPSTTAPGAAVPPTPKSVATPSSWPPPAGPLPVWLSQAHSGLFGLIRAEASWCARVLPAHAHTLVAVLLASILALMRQSLSTAFDRLPAQVSAANSHKSSRPAVLHAAANETTRFAQNIVGLLDSHFGPGFDAQAKRQLLSAALQPIDDWVSHWADIESAQLSEDLKAILPADLPQQISAPGASTEDIEAVLHQIGHGVRGARAHALQTIHRSEAVTGGSEVKSVAAAVDTQLSSFVGQLTGLARTLQQQAAKDWGAPKEGGVPPLLCCWMQLVVLAWEVGSSALLARVDAAMRASLATSASSLQAAAAKSKMEVLPDATVLRMGAKPQQLQQVTQLASSMSDPRNQLLPKTIDQVAVFGDAVQTGALEVLLAHVREAVQPLPNMPDWVKEEGQDSVAPMPSFSAAPLPYITTVGEYLMLLPHHLMDALAAAAASAQSNVGKGSSMAEATVSGGHADGSQVEDEEEVDVEGLAAHWLDATVTAAANVYAKAIAQVPALTQQGGAQLAADAEYFCNVMSALHVMPPPNLLTIQAFAGLPDDQFREAASSAASAAADSANNGAEVELTALRALSAARKIRLS